MFHPSRIMLALFAIFAMLVVGYSFAQASERTAFTREEAVILLNHKIGSNTNYDIGTWVIEHVEQYKKSHNPMAIKVTDNYQFYVAKDSTINLQGYTCSEVHILFKPMPKGEPKFLMINLCSKKNVVSILFLKQVGIQ